MNREQVEKIMQNYDAGEPEHDLCRSWLAMHDVVEAARAELTNLAEQEPLIDESFYKGVVQGHKNAKITLDLAFAKLDEKGES